MEIYTVYTIVFKRSQLRRVFNILFVLLNKISTEICVALANGRWVGHMIEMTFSAV